MHDILDSEIAQTGGYLTVLGGFGLWIIDELGKYEINDYFQSAMALGGAIFLFYKIANIRIDYKLKKQMLKEDGICKKCNDIGKDEEM